MLLGNAALRGQGEEVPKGRGKLPRTSAQYAASSLYELARICGTRENEGGLARWDVHALV